MTYSSARLCWRKTRKRRWLSSAPLWLLGATRAFDFCRNRTFFSQWCKENFGEANVWNIILTHRRLSGRSSGAGDGWTRQRGNRRSVGWSADEDIPHPAMRSCSLSASTLDALTQAQSQTNPTLPLSKLKLYLSKPLGKGRCSDC